MSSPCGRGAAQITACTPVGRPLAGERTIGWSAAASPTAGTCAACNMPARPIAPDTSVRPHYLRPHSKLVGPVWQGRVGGRRGAGPPVVLAGGVGDVPRSVAQLALPRDAWSRGGHGSRVHEGELPHAWSRQGWLQNGFLRVGPHSLPKHDTLTPSLLAAVECRQPAQQPAPLLRPLWEENSNTIGSAEVRPMGPEVMSAGQGRAAGAARGVNVRQLGLQRWEARWARAAAPALPHPRSASSSTRHRATGRGAGLANFTHAFHTHWQPR